MVGWRTDVEHVTAAQLLPYYHTYYIPNNATLVIVGDVDPAKIMTVVQQAFGPIPRGPEPPQWVTPEPPQSGERRVMVRRAGSLPMVMIGWHIPAITQEDIPALTLLGDILGTGRTSRFYQAIVEKELGVDAYAGTESLRDGGLFLAGGSVAPHKPIAPIEATLLAEIERIKTTPPSAAELARARRQELASTLCDRDSITEQANELGEAATVTGDYGYYDKFLAKLDTITPEDISRVAKLYLTEDNRTVGTFVPNKAGGGSSGSFGPMQYAPTRLAAMFGPCHFHAIDAAPADDAGASPALPAAGAVAAAAQPAKNVLRKRLVLPNGMVLVVQENHANKTVAMTLTLNAGKAYDPKGKNGLAEMTANLLDRGTQGRSSAEIAAEMEDAAASIDSGIGWETAGLHGRALSGDSELLLRNLADELRHPVFPAAEVGKMRTEMQAALEDEHDQPKEYARRNFYRAVLPADHPYYLPSFEESQAGLAAITRDDITAFHQAHYSPRDTILAVVGDVKLAEITALVEKYFGDWQGPAPVALHFPAVAINPVKEGDSIRQVLPDKSEVDIYVGHAAALTRTSADYYPAEIMNFILGGGGALNSRLGDVIRDQHGLAYGVYSDFHASTGAGPWYVMLGVNPTNVEKALPLLRAEITRMHDKGVTAQEISDAKAYLTGSYAIELETNVAMASTLADDEYFHRDLDYPEQIIHYFNAVTLEQVNDAAKKYLHPDALVFSIAGTVK